MVIRIYWANGDLEPGGDKAIISKVISECKMQDIVIGERINNDIPNVSWLLEVSKAPYVLSRPFEII